jgi:hypothetical protein
MPFVSEQQRKWMYVNKPKMAKKWAEHTPKKKLPKYVAKRKQSTSTGYMVRH